MKLPLHAIVLCIYLSLTVFSCSNNTPEQQETSTLPEIKINSTNEIIVSDLPSHTSISFSANKPWTLSSNQKWCIPDLKEGESGKFSILLNIEGNSDYDSREALITIQSGAMQKCVKLIQSQKDAIILSKNKYEIGYQKSTLSFKLQTNVEFTTSISEEWIKHTIDESRRLTPHTLSFDIEKNDGEKPREGSILFSSNNIIQKITIVQDIQQWQQIVIDHSLSLFTIPSFGGNVTNGHIEWGDNKEDHYQKGAQHSYTLSGNYAVTIKTKDAENVSFISIEGINRIDLSLF